METPSNPWASQNIVETKYKLKQEYVCMDRLSNISSETHWFLSSKFPMEINDLLQNNRINTNYIYWTLYMNENYG